MDDRLQRTADEQAAAVEGIRALRVQLGGARATESRRLVRNSGVDWDERHEPDIAMIEMHQLEAEMAWGVERSRLEARVAALEAETVQLRRALASILRHAADAVGGASIDLGADSGSGELSC